jgi:hypothetical protein
MNDSVDSKVPITQLGKCVVRTVVKTHWPQKCTCRIGEEKPRQRLPSLLAEPSAPAYSCYRLAMMKSFALAAAFVVRRPARRCLRCTVRTAAYLMHVLAPRFLTIPLRVPC